MRLCSLEDTLKEMRHGSLNFYLFIFFILIILTGTCHIINAVGDKTSKLQQIIGHRVAWYCALFCNMDVTDGRGTVDLVCTSSVE